MRLSSSRITATAVLLASLLLLSACSTMHSEYRKPVTEALPPPSDTASARYVQAEQDAHVVGHSGFRLLTLNTNALMSRLALAQKAEKSLDLQYYMFRDDNTGKLVAQHLIKAADRGVRVRLLLDDITQDEASTMFDALDAHPLIEVRLFNPFNTRQAGALSKAGQMLLEFRRLNRRMHNKSFIADNNVAIIGGRNIADEYFGANEASNYRDLDVVAIGPVVAEASRSFDAYWNDEATVPVKAYKSDRDPGEDLVKLRSDLDSNMRKVAASEYAQAMLDELPNGATADRLGDWFWGPAELVADQPEKIEAGDDQPGLRMGPALRRLITAATRELVIISPYFVPSDDDEKEFIALAKRGVAVRILTNSLASTDQAAVHSGYAGHRRALVAGGVYLFELKPVAGVKQTAAEKKLSGDVALHAKSFVVDGRYAFVGSMNMDQRSKLLNTEMGLVVDSADMSKAIVDYFEKATLPANAYRVGLQNEDGTGQLVWHTLQDGKEVTLTQEPGVTLLQQTGVFLMKLLPIDSLL